MNKILTTLAVGAFALSIFAADGTQIQTKGEAVEAIKAQIQATVCAELDELPAAIQTQLQTAKEAAEKAKIELSSLMETEINLPFVTADASGPKHLQIKLSRSKFEQLSDSLTSRLRAPFEAALRDADLSANGIDEIVLVGGSTRMPMIHDLVYDLAGIRKPEAGITEGQVVVHPVADCLNPRPAWGRFSEQGPGLLDEFVGFTIAACG